MTTQEIISTTHLFKTYWKGSVPIHAVAGISLRIEAGEFVALMGPSGAGKSTLLHLLGCLDSPTSGSYHLCQTDISLKNDTELSLLRTEKIGFVFQSFNLLPNYTVLENVLMPFIYRQYGDNPHDRKQQYEEKALAVLREIGMIERINHYPAELSGGEQQRAAIARALTQEPKILLADEPTGNLDTQTGNEIIDIFRKLNQVGMTILMVTHNPQLAQFATRRIYIKDGIIEKED